MSVVAIYLEVYFDKVDMIHSYWLKKQTAVHECLVSEMNQLLKDATYPEWLTQVRTVLIMKDPQKELFHPTTAKYPAST